MKKQSLTFSVAYAFIIASSGAFGQTDIPSEVTSAPEETTAVLEVTTPDAPVDAAEPVTDPVTTGAAVEQPANEEAVSAAAVVVETQEEPAPAQTAPVASAPPPVRGRSYEMSPEDWDDYRAKREENRLKRAEERQVRIAERYEAMQERVKEMDTYLSQHWDEYIDDARKEREKELEKSRAQHQEMLKQNEEMATRARERQQQLEDMRDKLKTMSLDERRAYFNELEKSSFEATRDSRPPRRAFGGAPEYRDRFRAPLGRYGRMGPGADFPRESGYGYDGPADSYGGGYPRLPRY